MKITGEMLFNSKSIIEIIMSSKLPLKVAIKVNKIALELNTVLGLIDTRRNTIIGECGEDMDEATKLFIAYLAEEIEIEIVKLNADELGDIEITPGEYSVVSWLFED